jgi:aldehyde dehydrogenase (NAD+)
VLTKGRLTFAEHFLSLNIMKTYQNFIDGRWLNPVAEGYFPDVNPADTSDVIAQFPDSGVEEIAAAVTSARSALPAWRALTGAQRGGYLYKAAGILERRLDEVAAALTREEGKMLFESKGETNRGVVILRYYAGEGMHGVGEVLPSAMNANTLVLTTRVPLGVVGLITPWNFPVAIPLWKAAPALAYGNTVVLKPAGLAPLTATLVAECFAEAGLPPGVFNLVQGQGRKVGQALVDHPHVNGISFTGSCDVGKRIAQACSARGAKYQLEMGGKNPVICLEDADLNQAIDLTISGAMRSAGHKCTATSRAIVVESVYQEFTKRLVDKVKALRVGPGTDPESYLGPVVNEGQMQIILDYIQRGKNENAKLLCGGERLKGGLYDKGWYVAPTVFADVHAKMTIAQEEIFGPVLAIIPVKNFEEAIKVANEVPFGLSASLFTRNLNRALDYVQQIEAGLIRVNGETAGVEPQAPFGGMKASSSYSREQGQAAKEFFTQVKTVYLDRSASL